MRFACPYVFVLVFFVNCSFSNSFSTCKTPSIKYGRIRSKQRGRIIKFLCNVGYQLAGERTAMCMGGSWHGDIPKCVRGTCPQKESPPPHGLVLPSHGGGVLNYYCQHGYELNGPGAVFCDGFTWDNHKPSCIPSGTKPKLFCDFEDVDICHWTHDLNHDMDWVRDSYKTPTGYSVPTGPSFDHTKGEGSNGHYMYIESSSRRINDTARLISPVFDKLDGNVCLEFWYHMYGKTTGTLRAYIRNITDPWPLDPSKAIFSKSGNQGNVWYRAVIDLGQIVANFQIVMEGVRGNGYISDIAIDDINIIPNCTFEDYIQSTTEGIPLASEVLKTIESCENRCGEKALGNETFQTIACDCDETCGDNRRCCPDYIDFCVFNSSTTEWEAISTGYTEIHITEGKLLSSNATITTNQTRITTTATPKTSARTTTVEVGTPPTMKKALVSNKNVTIPPLIILRPSPTPVIFEKIMPKFPQNKTISKITFVKPKNSTTVTVANAYHDDLDIPTKRRDNDEELLLTSPLPLEEDSNDINDAVDIQDKEDYVEKVSNEKDYPFRIGALNPEHVGEIKTELQKGQGDQSNFSLIYIAIATVCAIIILGVFVGAALVKLRFVYFRNRNMRSGQGNSQSDVRFLTADEVLDFGLDKEYDDL